MRYSLILISGLLLLTGCKVGPNYCVPVTPMPIAFSEDKQEETTPIADENLFHWWTILNDPFLEILLEESISSNFDYIIALERVCQARAQYWVQFTQILPELDFDAQASRFRVSQSFVTSAISPGALATAATPTATTNLSPIRNFFQTGFDVIWQIDLFGKFRRSADAAYDIWQATDEDARAVKITILSEVANTYVRICALQTKKSIAEQVVSLDELLYKLASERFQAGLAQEQEAQQALAVLEGDKAALNVVEKAFKVTVYSLAVLLGRAPETLIADFEIERPIPSAKEKIPAGVPSDLLRRRPDIHSAERQLASATEQIGVAIADLFPQLSLIGSSSSFAANPLQGANIGFSSDRLNKLFTHKSFIWGVGGLITWPVFDFGKRRATVDVQYSLAQQAYQTYQKTVIAALQETEQALASYFTDENRERQLNRAVLASKRSLDLAIDLYQAGLANETTVLQARDVWLTSLNNLTDSQQDLATDLIAVYKALGGDW